MKLLLILFSILLFGSNISEAQITKDETSVIKKPSILWGKIIPGPTKADNFKEQRKINLPNGYTLKKAIVNFAGAGFPTPEQFNLYEQDLGTIKDVVSRCVPGTVVYVIKILTISENGQEVFLSNAGFLLY